ncbi:hypothetical protein HBI56_094750 [Parastagonospora nodorum]|uniref:Secreted protein n=1 Tax=Phaeosphaeria nodorum (strain SN15 / ATCC MYA-4574 / FGSC 10173) TaxID=321614 RepID=A0A7U2I1C7_PHANO|nr:hypothetical protein HBH56_090040 [Parastagonospora nodorum]QRC98189.1 hypothetical protein JI435_303070 [Parastagonospora nodorum SN15]KAH3936512.1 hypothetical protein HBH54_024680 [Parastagonospora nodorum]KAH3945589.1 hypothetical protein HBH53_141780 [Parastagonospora nodorum]KAH4030042.1 hypothetical protein HBI13_036130 [Parastagonospora nodorum]
MTMEIFFVLVLLIAAIARKRRLTAKNTQVFPILRGRRVCFLACWTDRFVLYRSNLHLAVWCITVSLATARGTCCLRRRRARAPREKLFSPATVTSLERVWGR